MTFESTNWKMEKPEDEAFLLPNADEGSEDEEYKPNRTRPRRSYLLFSIILLSGTLNIFQAIWIIFPITSLSPNNHTFSSHESVGTVDQPLYPPSVYEWTVNSKATDRLFKAFDPDHGLVALPKGQPNVLPSEQFPWDASKEVYVLSGYHSLHSLQVIWQQLHRLSGDEPLGAHLLHSLNVLWEDVLCAANLTPLSISHKYVRNRTAIEEAGQTRQCRDWKTLEEFRVKNTACFKDLGAARHKKQMIEEWQFCPEDSPYKKVVDEYIAQVGH